MSTTGNGTPHKDDAAALSLMRDERRPSLFALTVSFMTVVMLVFVLVEGWRVWRDYRHAYATAQDTVTNLARATAQHAEDAIRQVDAITAALAERIEGDGIAKLNRPRLHALLAQQAAIMPQLHGLFVFGADGRWLVTDDSATPPNVNNADRSYFIYHQRHTDRQVHIGSVVKSRTSSELVIPISRRLEYPDGSFAGVLLGTINVDWFVRFYGAFKIDQRGALVLAKRDGTILVRRPFMREVVGSSLADSEIFRNHLPYADEGMAETVALVDNTPRLYGYKALRSYPLVAEAGLSRESIFMLWRHDFIKSVIILLLLLVGLAGFGLVVLRQVRERMAIEQALHRAHRTLRDLAMTDSLTGLGNRRRLDGVLDQEIRRARRQDYPIALVMMDLDYFKLFNDTYGHPAGDRCLRRVGEVLQATLKRPGDLAVRYGGEEFTLFLPATDREGAAAIVEEVLQAIRHERIEHARTPSGYVSASAGIAVVRPAQRDITAETLVAAADGALYRAKREGRDRASLVDLDHAGFHGVENPLG